MMLNFAAYVFAFIAYYAVGYAFQFGAVAVNAAPTNLGGTPTLNHFLLGSGLWGFLGGKGFFMTGPGYDAGSNVLALFEVVFMETAGYIIVGSICERITFWSFLLCELFVGAILYPVFGCWVWGGGWLSQLGNTMGLGHGYVDFAGSTVVHAVGGFCAMALSIVLGPAPWKIRTGRQAARFSGAQPGLTLSPEPSSCCSVDGVQSRLDPGRNRPSHFGGRDQYESGADGRIGDSDALLVLEVWQAGYHDGVQRNARRTGGDHRALRFCRADFGVHHRDSGRLVVCLGVLFNDNVTKIDDPCGAISVHGFCGVLGGFCLGIFADGSYGAGWNGVGAASYLGQAGKGVTGLLYGDTKPVHGPADGRAICVAGPSAQTFIVFKAVNAVKSMRVSKEVEQEGLDVPEFGLQAYPEDALHATEV